MVFTTQPHETGYALALGGLISAIMVSIGFPVIQRRYGTRKMYQTLATLWVAVYLSVPLLSITARAFVEPVGPDGVERLSSKGNMALWCSITVVVLLIRAANMMHP
jgi:hypothetical protein